jgi:hypothetical protein
LISSFKNTTIRSVFSSSPIRWNSKSCITDLFIFGSLINKMFPRQTTRFGLVMRSLDNMLKISSSILNFIVNKKKKVSTSLIIWDGKLWKKIKFVDKRLILKRKMLTKEDMLMWIFLTMRACIIIYYYYNYIYIPIRPSNMIWSQVSPVLFYNSCMS